MGNRKLVSIVTPCYNEAENVERHLERVRKAIEPLRARYDFEHIYTDNQSTDDTFSILKRLADEDSSVKVLRFSRNIGANRAIYFGLEHAAGDAAILIQGDLQDPPELIGSFIAGWEEGNDVVYGRIMRRDESRPLQWLRSAYYRVVAALSDASPPLDAGEFRLTSRRVLDAIKRYGENDLYLRGAIAHIGFPQKAVPFERAKRAGGTSSTGLAGLVAYAINGLLSTTVVPIRAVSVIGVAFAAVGLLLTAALVLSKFLFPGQAPRGVTLIATLITFFAGAQMLAIGVIGEYIRKIYIQSLNMPRGFVQDKINFR